jgi:membrane peptidoglycan carboxypeptidase
LPKIKEVKPQKIIPEIKNIIEENNTNKINENSIRDNIINRANGIRTSKSVNITKKNQFKFLSQEEELAKLEEEVAKFEEEYPTKKSYKRIDFSEVGDEWTAMANYNKRLYDRQVKEEKAKELELKKRTKEDLDYQVKQKLQKELEEKLREEEDNKIFVEHLKHIDELEKEKRKAIKEQLIKEKLNRDAQVKFHI